MIKISDAEKKSIVSTDDFGFYRWVSIEVILSEVIDFKKPVYTKAYSELQHLV
ncbi:MAG: hypothetical protein HOO06_16225 [Bdellovibrionaceae bacterium]|nr:hypothetical protein [Pseudobdellovibrionaceae bacterium]